MATDQSLQAQPLRIAVFGFYGNENLGDEAIVEAVIGNVREYVPGAELTCISVNPVDSAERHGVVADPIFVPASQYKSQRQKIAEQKAQSDSGDSAAAGSSQSSWRSKLKALPLLRPAISLLRKAIGVPSALKGHLNFAKHIESVMGRTDVLLISGSNQFLDNFGGPWAFPYTLWMWTRIARKHKVPVFVLCVGAGPISSRLSMRLIRSTIDRTIYLSLRDSGSAQVLGLAPVETNILPDLAFSHQSPTVESALTRDFSLTGLPVIGINPMAVHARGYWHEVDDEKYARYVGKLAELVRYLENANREFIFLSNQPRDDLVIADIVDAAIVLGSERSNLESQIQTNSSVDEYLQNACKADIVIATRFHGTVLNLLLARPVIGLCYHEKSVDLLNGFSLGSHAYDMDDFALENVISSIDTLTREYEVSAGAVARRVLEFRSQLKSQYLEIEKIVREKRTSA